MLGKSPIKWRQSPDMTIAVGWDVKYQFKQTKIKMSYSFFFFQKAGVKLKNLLNRSSIKKILDKNYELKYVSKHSGKVFTWENVFKVGQKVVNLFQVIMTDIVFYRTS